MTLGSLFDGSGGFSLAGLMNGIEPKWSSEVEPFCIRVTSKRLPTVKHYGDVSTLSGRDLAPVDIITFGSPCQDLSIAGRRTGLEDGERSNLFYQAVRIIKEMRNVTNGRYPRYAVWENVPGALTSNKGEDFRSVLESLCQVKSHDYVPRPQKWGVLGTSWETVTLSHGESSMLNTGESPRDVEESSLSQILMEQVPERYSLSRKACQGILARAERRGRVLPPLLKEALEWKVGSTKTMPKIQESENLGG